MQKILIYISATLVLATLFFFFRPKNNIRHELVLAEKVMNDHPDSALHILEKMKSGALIGENKALYALLTTQAQFKNRIYVSSDSLIKLAFDYYVKGKVSLRKAQVYFYLGRVNVNLEKNDKALRNFQEASVAASQIDNKNLLALIYSHWGILLQDQQLFEDALLLLQKSLNYSEADNDTLMQISVLKEIGKTYSLNKEYGKALNYYMPAFHLAQRLNNKLHLSWIYNNLSILYKNMGEYGLAMNYINEAFTLKSDSSVIYSWFFLKADIFSLQQKYDSAKYYLSLGKRGNDLIYKIGYGILMSDLEEKLGNYEKALIQFNEYIPYRDSYEHLKKRNAILEIQKKYDYTLMKYENNRLKIAEQQRDKVLLLVGLIIAISLTLFIYTNSKRRSLKRAMKDELKKMEDNLVKQHLIYAQEKTIEMQRYQNEFLIQQKEMDVELSRKSEALMQQQEKERDLKEQIFKLDAIVQKINAFNSMKPLQRSRSESQFTLSFRDLCDLEEALNLCYDNFAERLRNEFPKLKDDDIHLCCLLKMKVPNKNILSLLDTNELALKKRRYRIKHDKMELDEDISSLDEFLSNY